MNLTLKNTTTTTRKVGARPDIDAHFIEDWTTATDAELFFALAFATHSPINPADWLTYFDVPYGENPEIGKAGASALESAIVEAAASAIKRIGVARYKNRADRDEHFNITVARLLDRSQALSRMSLALPSSNGKGGNVAPLNMEQVASTIASSKDVLREVEQGRELKAQGSKRTPEEQNLDNAQLRNLRTPSQIDFTLSPSMEPIFDEWDEIDARLDAELFGGTEGGPQDIDAWFRSATEGVLTLQQQDVVTLYARLDQIVKHGEAIHQLGAQFTGFEEGEDVFSREHRKAIWAAAQAEFEAANAQQAIEVNAAWRAHLEVSRHSDPTETERKRGGPKPGFRSHDEVSRILGCSQPTVSRELKSARERVAKSPFATVALQGGFVANATYDRIHWAALNTALAKLTATDFDYTLDDNGFAWARGLDAGETPATEGPVSTWLFPLTAENVEELAFATDVHDNLILDATTIYMLTEALTTLAHANVAPEVAA